MQRVEYQLLGSSIKILRIYMNALTYSHLRIILYLWLGLHVVISALVQAGTLNGKLI